MTEAIVEIYKLLQENRNFSEIRNIKEHPEKKIFNAERFKYSHAFQKTAYMTAVLQAGNDTHYRDGKHQKVITEETALQSAESRHINGK